MNNKKQSDIQFTELTPNDIAVHEDIYIKVLGMYGIQTTQPKYFNIYYEYAIKEILKANDLFQKTFK